MVRVITTLPFSTGTAPVKYLGLSCAHSKAGSIRNINKSCLDEYPTNLYRYAPFTFSGTATDVKFYTNASSIPMSYELNYNVLNYNAIKNNFFNIMQDETFKNLIGFTEDIYRPMVSNLTFGTIGYYESSMNRNDYWDVSSDRKSDV